ncbi:HNH endonuclease [Streptomyces albipurpureus]|uniref:HNH endonuclease n=1 Tax=Streptomyces albipurpureus TaxID=2897419 RepID=UPI003CE449BF
MTSTERLERLEIHPRNCRVRFPRPVPRPIHITPIRRIPDPPTLSRRDVLRRWEELEWWSCTYCDRAFSETLAAEVDHIRPLARGGLHIFANLTPACGPCNASKGGQLVAEWLSVRAGQVGLDQ